MSDDLLDRLVDDLRPVPRNALPLLLTAAVAVGAIIAALVMVPWIGLRHDFPAAFLSPIFWLKFTYPLLVAVAGWLAVERLSRPGETTRRPLLMVIGLVALVAILGVMQLVLSPAADAQRLVLGGSAIVCPWYIVALSAPVFVVTIAAMRRLAPTSPTLAGLAAGILAGGVGAWVYSFHCGESGVPFTAIFYTLGMAVVAAVGALTGRYLLRW